MIWILGTTKKCTVNENTNYLRIWYLTICAVAAHLQLNSSCPEGKVLGLWPAHFCHKKIKERNWTFWDRGNSPHVWQESQEALLGPDMDEASRESHDSLSPLARCHAKQQLALPEAGPAAWMFAPFVCAVLHNVQGKRIRPTCSDISLEFENKPLVLT